MSEISTVIANPTPVRLLSTDDPFEILSFAADAFVKGGVALATLIEIQGGAARALGSHVVIAADGQFCGYVSGGCVEAAVAAEAMLAIAEQKDRTVSFGAGSPYFDIELPCGGGITVAIHVLTDVTPIHKVLGLLKRRQQAGLQYSAEHQSLEAIEPSSRSYFRNGNFYSVYFPRIRVIVSGKTIEAEAVASIAKASGYDVLVQISGHDKWDIVDAIDSFTAIVLLHHDLDTERWVLDAALRSSAFYLGALGSARTHRRRVEQLLELGWLQKDIDRIKAPIGIFGPARESNSLALSVLADIAACRLANRDHFTRESRS